MTHSRFHSLSEVERILRYKPRELVDVLLEIRNIVARIAPEATERIRAEGFTYYFSERGGPVKAGICGVVIRDDRVRISFAHGVFLDDPMALLRGDRLYMRFHDIKSYDNAPWDDIENLIRSSAEFDPAKLDLS